MDKQKPGSGVELHAVSAETMLVFLACMSSSSRARELEDEKSKRRRRRARKTCGFDMLEERVMFDEAFMRFLKDHIKDCKVFGQTKDRDGDKEYCSKMRIPMP